MPSSRRRSASRSKKSSSRSRTTRRRQAGGAAGDLLFTKEIISDYFSHIAPAPPRGKHVMFKEKTAGHNAVDVRDEMENFLANMPCKFGGYTKMIIERSDYVYFKEQAVERVPFLSDATTIQRPNGPKAPSKTTISALVIAEKGYGCNGHSEDVWHLELICGSPGNNDARTLLGLYCYALKVQGYKLGFLHVAGSYNNKPAYCLYTKFGFKEIISSDLEHLGWDCPDDLRMLPMLLDVEALSLENIVNVVQGRASAYKPRLCEKIPGETKEDQNVRQNAIIRDETTKWTLKGFSPAWSRRTLRDLLQDVEKSYYENGTFPQVGPLDVDVMVQKGATQSKLFPLRLDEVRPFSFKFGVYLALLTINDNTPIQQYVNDAIQRFKYYYSRRGAANAANNANNAANTKTLSDDEILSEIQALLQKIVAKRLTSGDVKQMGVFFNAVLERKEGYGPYSELEREELSEIKPFMQNFQKTNDMHLGLVYVMLQKIRFEYFETQGNEMRRAFKRDMYDKIYQEVQAAV